MKHASEAAILMTEAVYGLETAEEDWLSQVMEACLPLLDHGLGVAGLIGTRPASPGPLDIERMHVAAGPEDFTAQLMRTVAELPSTKVHAQASPGVRLLSEIATEAPGLLEAWGRHVDYAKDGIGVTALDPDGRGVALVAPIPKVATLTVADRRRWQMLAAHLSSGLRLRKALANRKFCCHSPTDALPYDAQAVVDPKSFEVAHAVSDAQEPTLRARLRHAAIGIDQARGSLRKNDSLEPLELWSALVGGRWSLVDWFDTDQRRFVLALPNPPNVVDPRGLTERERQVAAYAALGETHKMIAYRLGISRTRVTDTLGVTMRKLGVKTQAQLVEKLSAFGRKALEDDALEVGTA